MGRRTFVWVWLVFLQLKCIDAYSFDRQREALLRREPSSDAKRRGRLPSEIDSQGVAKPFAISPKENSETSFSERTARRKVALTEIAEPKLWDFAAELGLWIPFEEWEPPDKGSQPSWWGSERASELILQEESRGRSDFHRLRVIHRGAHQEATNGTVDSSLELRATANVKSAHRRETSYAARLMLWIPQVIYRRDDLSGLDISSEAADARNLLGTDDAKGNLELASNEDELFIEHPPKPTSKTRFPEYRAVLAQSVPLVDYQSGKGKGRSSMKSGRVSFTPRIENGRYAGFTVIHSSSSEHSNETTDTIELIPEVAKAPIELAERELWVNFAHMGCASGNSTQARTAGWCIAPSAAQHGPLKVEKRQREGQEVVEVTFDGLTGPSHSNSILPNYASELGLRTVLSSCNREEAGARSLEERQQKDSKVIAPSDVKLATRRSKDGSAYDIYDFSFDKRRSARFSRTCTPRKPNLLAQKGVWVPLSTYTSSESKVVAAEGQSTRPTKHWNVQGHFDDMGALTRFTMHSDNKP